MHPTTTVLIVDDSLTARSWASHALAELRSHWAVVEAASAEEALEKCDAARIDGALIDLNMPGMDGFELASRLERELPELRIAVLTADIQERTRARAEERGYQFIAKPLTARKLEPFAARLEP